MVTTPVNASRSIRRRLEPTFLAAERAASPLSPARTPWVPPRSAACLLSGPAAIGISRPAYETLATRGKQ
jgi:hypothetical protein